jgi:thymidine phosphorylase
VGLIFHRKLGARVQSGDTIVTVHAPAQFSNKERMAELETVFHESIEITGVRKPVPKLVMEVI